MRRASRLFTIPFLLAASAMLGCPTGEDELDASVADAGPDLGLVDGAVVIPHGAALDVSVDGDRVLLLDRALPTTSPIEGTGPAFLSISDDRGRSFRGLELPASVFQDLHPFAVHAALGRAWMLLADRMFVERVVAREVDLETGALGPAITLDAFDFHFGPDAITGFSLRNVSPTTAVAVRFDLRTGEVTRTEQDGGAQCDGIERPRMQSADGETFLRVCYRPYERCVQRGRVSTGALEEACTSWRDWPVPWREPQEDVLLGDRVLRLWSSRAQLRARDLLASSGAPALGTELDLGEGRIESPGVRTHYEDVLVLSDTFEPGALGHRRIVTLRDDALLPLAFPDVPCAHPDVCVSPSSLRPYAALQAVAPIGGGEWLGVYALAGATVALAIREGEGTPPPFDPIADAPEGVGGVWLTFQPGDSALEHACAMAISCPGGLAMSMQNCLEYWERIRGPESAEDPAYLRFVATPPGDCAALVETFPAKFADCAARCLPDGRSIECAREGTTSDSFHEVRECAAFGASCVTTGSHAGCSFAGMACDVCDPTGRATLCDADGAPDAVDDCAARSLTCWADGAGATGCRSEPPSPYPSSCEGSVHVTRGTSAVETQRRDCARSHLPCQRDRGCTWSGTLFGGVCEEGGVTVTGCDGEHLTWCSGGFYRFVDCVEIGATGCDRGRCSMP